MPSRPGCALLAALAVVASLATPSARAWGPSAHRAVGAVAQARLCAPARAQVRALLGTQQLGDAAVWPDTIRRAERWSHTADWHYADVEDDEPMAHAWRGDRGRLFIALDEQLRLLGDASAPAPERADALRFVAHLLADVHQPLHVGRPSDKGGNDIPVRLGDRDMNLHKVWDSGLFRAAGLNWRDLQAMIEPLVELGISRRGGVMEDWAEESRALRPWVYAFDARMPRPRLSLRYEAVGRHLAVERLADAAGRLEDTLEALWCSPASPGNEPR